MTTQPIFLFSLPRSGSTLLQRMLAGHPDICTHSELWFLLPHLTALTGNYTYSQYSTSSLRVATKGLLKQLPNSTHDYYDAIRYFSDHIYSRLATSNEKYVLDKTPRYYFIIDEIASLYPDAKFIFLFRNPLSVAASLVDSFNRGKLGDFRHRIDMYEGPRLLADGYRKVKDRSYAVTFENLVQDPDRVLRSICSYLGVPFNDEMSTNFSNVPVGNLGDQFGSSKYSKLDSSRVDSWGRVFSTTFRRKYLCNYMKYIGKDVVTLFGYDYDKLLSEVHNSDVEFSFGIMDRYNLLRCSIISMLEGVILKDKLSNYRVKRDKFFLHH